VGKPIIKKVTGYDPKEEKVVQGEIRIEVNASLEAIGNYSGISFTIGCETSALTIAADVLANSVYYHLKKMQEKKMGHPLNTTEAISGHPLASLIFGAWDSKETNFIPDAVFMHPNQKGE